MKNKLWIFGILILIVIVICGIVYFYNNKEKNDWKNIGEGNWREYLSPTIELLENKGAASGIMAKHPKILKIISAAMLLCVSVRKGTTKRKDYNDRNRLCVTSWRRYQ